MVSVDPAPRGRTFTYVGVEVEPTSRSVTCRYLADETPFVETARFDGSVDLTRPGIDEMARLYFLVAGLSYYKATAARTIDLGATPVGPATVALLRACVTEGLGEFAYRNSMPPLDIELAGGTDVVPRRATALARGHLVPFGGGIDSIVTTSLVTEDDLDAALFIVGARRERFVAIEDAATRTKLPITRCGRYLDDKILHPREHGYLDGHVPVTAMVSSLALIAAVASSRCGVAMSNERSASSPTIVDGGVAINHQWSKSLEFEDLLRAAIGEHLDGGPTYASWLRDRSELWVASELARRPEFLGSFMSCNRAFRQDPAARASTWCGECAKCLFIDLVLAPFVDRETLEQIFSGREPIADGARIDDLAVLVGVEDDGRPFECVGDKQECATALVATAARADRADQVHLAALAARCGPTPSLESMLAAAGPTNVAARHAAHDVV